MEAHALGHRGIRINLLVHPSPPNPHTSIFMDALRWPMNLTIMHLTQWTCHHLIHTVLSLTTHQLPMGKKRSEEMELALSSSLIGK